MRSQAHPRRLGQWGDPWPASWPTGVALQLHITEGEEDHEITQTLAATVPNDELIVDRGQARYFAEHDQRAAALLHRRALDFLQALEAMNFAPPGGLIL